MKATPEELVRQKWLFVMTQKLGFPLGLISVERGVHRRFDLCVYNKNFSPLLLMECKACDLKPIAEAQVMGYNETVQAPFICLANDKQIKTIWYEQTQIVSVPFLPTYDELLSKL